MDIAPDIAIWLAWMREWAADTGALIYAMQGRHGTIAIFPDDVSTRTDAELLAFVRARCAE